MGSTVRLNGFMIVRQRDHYFRYGEIDDIVRSSLPADGPRRCRGVMRDSWDDVGRLKASRQLPAEVLAAYERIPSFAYCANVPLCANREDVELLWRFTSSLVDTAELIGVWSEELLPFFDSVEVESDRWQLLGYDVVLLNGWSLIEDGYMLYRSDFASVHHLLNDDGLLKDPNGASILVDRYLELGLEPFQDDDEDDHQAEPVVVGVWTPTTADVKSALYR